MANLPFFAEEWFKQYQTVESLEIRNKTWRKATRSQLGGVQPENKEETKKKNKKRYFICMIASKQTKKILKRNWTIKKLYYIYFQAEDDKRMYSKVKEKNATKS